MATKVAIELDDADSKIINIFAILIIFIFLIIFYIINNKKDNSINNFEATFNFVDGLTTESKVLISGIEVGNIKSISLLPDNKVFVSGYIDSFYKIPKDSILKINTHGIFGKKYLSILPGFDDFFDKDQINFLYTSDSYTIDYLARYLENKDV